jgi:hypothetical protein
MSTSTSTTMNLAAYDRTASRPDATLTASRDAAFAAVKSARWIRALRLDASEMVADLTSAAAVAIAAAEHEAGQNRRTISDDSRRTIAADAAREELNALHQHYRRNLASAIGSEDDPAAVAAEAAADLAAERGHVQVTSHAADHLDAEIPAALRDVPVGLADALMHLAYGKSAATIAAATDRDERTVKRSIKRGRVKAEKMIGRDTPLRVQFRLAELHRERIRADLARAPRPERNGERKPHAAKHEHRERTNGPTFPVKNRKARKVSDSERARSRRESERRAATGRREWREASALRIAQVARSLYA